MLQAYFERGMTDTAVFELFVRKLPPGREFLVAAGLEQALEFAAQLRVGDEELDWIRGCGVFKPAFNLVHFQVDRRTAGTAGA